MERFAIRVMAVAVGCLLYPGCAPTYRDPVTGAQARYEWETLRAQIDDPITTVYVAACDAMDQLDLPVLQSDRDGIAAEILAVDAHRDTVEIRLEALPESRTLLTIRVGIFGHKNKSVVLFERILENLGGRGSHVASTRRYSALIDPMAR